MYRKFHRYYLWIISGCLLIPALSNAQCIFPITNKTRTITYRFTPDNASHTGVLHVTVQFYTGKKGNQPIQIPTRWANENFYAITNLRAASEHASIKNSSGQDSVVVYAPANSTVILTYDLRKDWIGSLAQPMQFHPIVMPSYFQFTGSNALIKPEIDDAAITTVNFDWENLPVDWTIATSFGAGERGQERCQSHTGPWREVNQGLYAAGDFRLYHFMIGPQAAILAIRGSWLFTDQQAIEKIQQTVGTVRRFWHDKGPSYFLVTVLPYDRDRGSSNGSAFTNAFWMYLSRLDNLDKLLPQLTHEAFHAWNPMRMGFIPIGEYDHLKWFKEGVTEYYAQLVLLRAGKMDTKQYVTSLNDDLSRFATSNSEYVRGRIIALWLDGEIRKESNNKHSLDDMMFAMLRKNHKPLTEERVLKTAAQFVSEGAVQTLKQAAEQHGPLSAPKRAPGLPACIQAQLHTVPEFNLGFDYVTTRRTAIVSGVVPGGAADVAGLRNGQEIRAMSVLNGDASRPANLKVVTSSGIRTIEYMPRGRMISIWRYTAESGTHTYCSVVSPEGY
ncbi:MAG: hypothetical protein JSS87_02270 [Acidobacteria bacterium]|nr:hypothetical protein [Acidobacteriota bacterium]